MSMLNVCECRGDETEREGEKLGWENGVGSHGRPFSFVLFFFLTPGHLRVFLMGPYAVSVTLYVNAGLRFSFFGCGSNLVQ